MAILDVILGLIRHGKQIADDVAAGKSLVKEACAQLPQDTSFAVLAELEMTVDGKKQRMWITNPIDGKKKFTDEQKGIFYVAGDKIAFLDVHGSTIFNVDAPHTTFITTKGRSVIITFGTSQYEIDDLQSLRPLFSDMSEVPMFAKSIEYRDRMGLGEIIDALQASGSQQIQ